MSFRDMFGGGPKSGGGQNFAQNQNPFKNFLNQMVMGKANVGQKLEGFYPDDQKNMQIPPEFEKEWETMSKEFNQMNMSEKDMERHFNEMWHHEQMRQREMEKMMHFEQERAWKEAEQNQKNMEMQKQVGQWENEFNEYYSQEFNKEFEEAFQKAQEDVGKAMNKNEQEVIKDAATDIISVMMDDPDPKFQNSKFLQFMKNVQNGTVKIENNEVVEDNQKEEEMFKDFDNVWSAEETKFEQQQFQNAWQNEEQKFDGGDQKLFDEAWKNMNLENQIEKDLEKEYEKMMEQYGKIDPKDYEKMFSDVWQAEQDREEHELHGDIPQDYKFSNDNPYSSDEKALQTAFTLINKGKTRDAILALESHLQKNNKDVRAWKMLGKLHQDNDQDRIAVTCLLKSMEIDNKDLDTLLTLGVSCTNILDEVQAMNHLKNWMLNNEKYKSLNLDPKIIPENSHDVQFKVEQIEEMNRNLLAKFEQAKQLEPKDPDLLTSLAVLYFISRNYKASVELFNAALTYDPTNYSLWNKLGATLAHLGRTDEAMEAYHKALEYKPNYVRCWVNLGIAHAFKGEHKDAAELYLNALSMNPNAKHVWTYLQTCLISMQRWDLIPKVKDEDVNLFKNDFEISNFEDLPEPEIEYKAMNEKFLIKGDTNNWVKDFEGSN